MGEKIFHTMGEVAEMFDLPPSTLRYWEANFPSLRPNRNRKGNRLYQVEDIEIVKKIYHLVKVKGLKIEAAAKYFSHSKGEEEASVNNKVELVERLQKIRAMLLEIKQYFGDESAVGHSEIAGNSQGDEPPQVSDPASEVILREDEIEAAESTNTDRHCGLDPQSQNDCDSDSEIPVFTGMTEKETGITEKETGITEKERPFAVEQLLF